MARLNQPGGGLRRRLRMVAAALLIVAGGVVQTGAASPAHADPLPGPLATPQLIDSASPNRILDTRYGIGAPVGVVPPGNTVALMVRGVGGVPLGAQAVALNVTLAGALGAGHVTVWPCRETMPTASNLNVLPGQTVPNLVIAKIDGDGRVCLYTYGGGDLIADVNAWFPAGSLLTPITPDRILDTRYGIGVPPGVVAPGGVVALQVAGRAGVPTGNGAAAVALNVTLAAASGPGHVTVWPCGEARPTASNLNVGPGQTVPNLVIAKLGAGGQVCLYTYGGGHLIADVDAWFPPRAGLTPIVPERLLDTRYGIGAPTGLVPAGGVVELQVVGPGGAPGGSSNVVLNVTMAEVQAAGHVIVWPCGETRPTASNLNVVGGQTVANLVIARVGAGGKVCLFTLQPGHLIADLNGYFIPPAPLGTAGVSGPPVAGGPLGGVTRLRATAALAGDVELTAPVRGDADTPLFDPSTIEVRRSRPQMFGEPIFPITKSAYADTIPPAIGRLVGFVRDPSLPSGFRVAGACSGTVVGPNLVLTAAHCTEDEFGQPFAAYGFVPGLTATTMPFDSFLGRGHDAWVPSGWYDYAAYGAQVLFDYAIIRFDPAVNAGRSLSAVTGTVPMLMADDLLSSGRELIAAGYPAEGRYADGAGSPYGRCNIGGQVYCAPYFCQSFPGDTADAANGWQMIGYGCDGNGGMSGSGLFTKIDGAWYVVGVHSYGGYLYGPDDQPCTDRATCSWYMLNGWAPTFRVGVTDALWNAAAAG